jgi:hypothetical protein
MYKGIMEKIDLIHDDYTKIRWPIDELHSDQFPYLVIRLMSATYSPIAVPEGLRLDALISWAVDFSAQYGYGCCLVMGEEECYYISPNGEVRKHGEPPSGGNVINWRRLQDDSDDSVIIVRKPNSDDFAIAARVPGNDVSKQKWEVTLEPPNKKSTRSLRSFLLRLANNCQWNRLPRC